ncbi:MAG TPA: phosphohistidine phosphatase SixA [Dehalococcoidia bacterium]|nr:phosphohistidine phosphatase SixA [Dehalococcoidia bacterium]
MVRHGPAGNPEANAVLDRERPLSTKGKRQTKRAMRGIAVACPDLACIVTSPLVRAAQTAELLKKQFKNAELRVDDRLAPDGDWRGLVDELANSGQAVAVVGHDPQLSTLVASLCSNGRNSSFVALAKGGAAGLTRGDHGWTLDWLATREQLEQMK